MTQNPQEGRIPGGTEDENAPPAAPVAESRFRRWRAWQEAKTWLAPISLIGLAAFFLRISWRKWPDPLIDFGRELYLPWRLAHGAVLYRDVDDFFGPLSQYLNAALFRIFGPGMLVLVAANLCVFTGIVVAIYRLFRRGWSTGPAFLAAAIFISIFGFGQYVGIANYNYATPYSHESTHGLLVCLLLAFALLRWVESPSKLGSAAAGGLFGLTAVLKPDIILAAGLMTIAAAAVHWRYRRAVPLTAIGVWAGSAAVPTLGFAVYFSVHVPWKEALALACHAWLNAGSVLAQSGPLQAGFVGLDRPWENLWDHARATLAAILSIGGIAGVARIAEGRTARWQRWLLGGVLAGGMGWLSLAGIDWSRIGRCLPGLALLYVAICVTSVIRDAGRRTAPPGLTLRLLAGVLAAGLISRMLLNGRIYQYGFYEAPLAFLLVPAVMMNQAPAWLGLGRWGKTIVAIGSLALIAPGLVIIAGQSQDLLRMKTLAVGQGADRFYTFPEDVEPTGEIVRLVTDWLRRLPPGQTLAVLPEGEMINYLARMPGSVAEFVFYSAAMGDDSDETMVNDLSRRPPDWIVVISRDLREYGIQRYGEGPGRGEQIMRWVAANYSEAASVGGNPLDVRSRGALILRRKGAPGP